jgi:hypothetical protein
MRKKPTRTLSIVLGGRGDALGSGDGDGLACGEGEGLGVGLGAGLGDALGRGLGLADGLGVGLTGVPPGPDPGTRIVPGRVGSSSVIVQPHAETRANPASQCDILIGPSP